MKKLWIDGVLTSEDKVNLHPSTHSLHYSGSVFEGIRSYNGKIFKLYEHTTRLLNSAQYMGLNLKYSVDEICDATLSTLKANNLRNTYIRQLIWRGECNLGLYNSAHNVHLLIMIKDSNPSFKSNMSLYLSPWRKISPNSIPPQSKCSAHYTISMISQKSAKDNGYDDALIVDHEDYIAECSTANIFFAKDNLLITPIADRFLNGITRQTVIEIAKNMNLTLHQKRISLNDIDKYDCSFVTGTSVEIRGVRSIFAQDKNIYFPQNELTNKLQRKFSKITGKNYV